MEVPLSLLLLDNPRFLQQVVVDVTPDRVAFEVEMDVHVFAEAGRVVVSVCLRIAKRFQNCIGLQQDVLHSGTKRKHTDHFLLDSISGPQQPTLHSDNNISFQTLLIFIFK